MIYEIKSRYTGGVIYSGEGESLRHVVQQAVASGADLSGANLSADADLILAAVHRQTAPLQDAAPDLLAACRDALEVEEAMAQCPDSELAKRLRSAIAKATGAAE